MNATLAETCPETKRDAFLSRFGFIPLLAGLAFILLGILLIRSAISSVGDAKTLYDSGAVTQAAAIPFPKSYSPETNKYGGTVSIPGAYSFHWYRNEPYPADFTLNMKWSAPDGNSERGDMLVVEYASGDTFWTVYEKLNGTPLWIRSGIALLVVVAGVALTLAGLRLVRNPDHRINSRR